MKTPHTLAIFFSVLAKWPKNRYPVPTKAPYASPGAEHQNFRHPSMNRYAISLPEN